MKLTFYGVRGSIAAPHANTIKYGGNTSCVLVDNGQDDILIFDAGTGIRTLGEQLSARGTAKKDIYILFSHFHWDHIQGFPFFSPAYQTGQKIHLISAKFQNTSKHPILEQFTHPYFPMKSEQLKASIKYQIVESGIPFLIKNMAVTSKLLNHEGGGLGYRVDSPQGSIAYITDNELFPPTASMTDYQKWSDFLQDIDLLIHDAMYLDHELEKIHGWGHSLVSQVLQLAYDVKATAVVLFHHDPKRTDEQLDQIKQDSIHWMKNQKPSSACQVFVAKEGDCYEVTANTIKALVQ